MKQQTKYEAKLHINANTDKVEFIGTVKGNSLKEIKEKAKSHARSWNKHLSGRIHVSIENIENEFFVNP